MMKQLPRKQHAKKAEQNSASNKAAQNSTIFSNRGSFIG